MKRLWSCKISQSISTLLVGFSLASCAPDDVPRDASHEWDFINGSIWYWGDKLETGCTAWMASERWISVQLVTDTNCSTNDRHDRLSGKRVFFGDIDDYLLFKDYGPWSYEIHDGLTVYDTEGNFIGFRACPHNITPEDISNMNSLSQEAATIATTAGEKDIMDRASARFGKVDLSALSGSYLGCTDEPLKRPPQSKSKDSSQ